MLFDDLPDEIKVDIFSYIDLKDYAEVASVKKSWNLMLNDSVTWVMKLKKANIYAGSDILYFLLSDLSTMRSYYVLHKKCNLLKNVNMDKGIEDWGPSSKQKEVNSPVTDSWEIKGDWMIETHLGCDPFPEEAGAAYNNAVTSYMDCIRRQTIVLSKHLPNIGILGENGFKVKVFWSVWVAPRYDCISRYAARLVQDSLPDKSLEKVDLDAGKKWLKLSKTVVLDMHDGDCVFTYEELGKDRKFWAGHYGAKILNPMIRVKIIPGN